MKRILLVTTSSLLVVLAMVVQASANQPEAERKRAEQLVTRGRLEDGIVACSLCHQVSGKGSAAYAFGNLTGLSMPYFEKQLLDYQAGRRENRVMQRVSQKLSRRDIAALARYFSNLKVGSNTYKIPDGPWIGKTLAEDGDEARALPACNSCHLDARGNVNSEMPNIFGQHAHYIINQLTSWQMGLRRNDSGSVMTEIAKKLSTNEIRSVAVYYASKSRSKP